MPDSVRVAEPSKEVEHIQDPEAERTGQGVVPKRPFVLEKRRGTGAGNLALMLTVIGVIVMFGICTVAFLSSKDGVKRKSREDSAKPSLGRPLASSAPGDLIPNDKVKPSPDQTAQDAAVHASDIERTKSPKSPQSQAKNGEESASSGKPLSKIAKFDEPDTSPSSAGNWTPPPYGSGHEADQRSEKKEDEAYGKPSLVFIAHHQPTLRNEQGAITRPSAKLGLAPGYHVAARLESMATTAVHAPVTAIVEYNYERDGQTLIPAGSRVVGKISQADPAGMVNMTFSSIEFPSGEAFPIEAMAADMNLQALRGQVTGKQRGKSMLVRSLSGIGETAAMVVGAPSANSAFSENDLIRMRIADNVGNASDEQIMKMMAMEHIVVSVPAGTEFYVIFEKSTADDSASGAKTIKFGSQDTSSGVELSGKQSQVEGP
jgi:type IV secretory pathway VirB10-like protein